MARLYLIRHGEAASGWGEDLDPPLSNLGKSQAAEIAERFGALEPLQMITSPIRRAYETSLPLAKAWGFEATIEKGVGEIPSPTAELDERAEWLRGIMGQNWADQDAALQSWRANVVRALADLPQDTVVFSHLIAINAAVGAATADDRIVSFRPANCSVTILESVMDELRLVEHGAEAETRVN